MISMIDDENVLPVGSTLCLLCNGIVAYKGEDKDRFYNHMKHQHGVFFNLEFIKAGCLMDDDEKAAVIGIMERKENAIDDEDCDEAMDLGEKLLTEEDYMEVIEESENKSGDKKNSVSDKTLGESSQVTSGEKSYNLNLISNESTTNSTEVLSSCPKPIEEEITDTNLMNKEAKFIESVKDDLLIFKKDEEAKVYKDESIKDDSVFNMKELPVISDVKFREVRINLPLLNIKNVTLPRSNQSKSEEGEEEKSALPNLLNFNNGAVKDFILGNALLNKKESKIKVFTCNICNKDFQTNFNNLVRHKIKIHKSSKKTAKIISMQHVRYEKVVSKASESKKFVILKANNKEHMDQKCEEIMEKEEQSKKAEIIEYKAVSEETLNEKGSKLMKLSNDSVYTCVLCKLKVATDVKFKAHLKNRHVVPESKLAIFTGDEESLVQLGKDNVENKNNCNICDMEHDNLGKLWNHYKRTHRVKKETIKSLISKSKCTICSAQVTFIGDHYRAFHRLEREKSLEKSTSNISVKTEIKPESKHQANVLKETLDGSESYLENEFGSPSKKRRESPLKIYEVKGGISDEDFIAKLPTSSLTQFPQFFEEMKKMYPGKSEKEIKLKTIQMFKKVRLQNPNNQSPKMADKSNQEEPISVSKSKPVVKVKDEPLSSNDLVTTKETPKKGLIQIKTEEEPEPSKASDKTSPPAPKLEQSKKLEKSVIKILKSYDCSLCESKVPHLWDHYRDNHKMSKEQYIEAMQTKNKKAPIQQNQNCMKNSIVTNVNTFVVQQALPELELTDVDVNQELFIIDGGVGNGLVCNYCDFTCNRKENLTIHTQLKHADNLRNDAKKSFVKDIKLECEACNLVLTKAELEAHKKIVHSNFSCDDCGDTFTNRKEFRNHTIRHMMNNEVQAMDVVMNNQPKYGDGISSAKRGIPAPKNLKEEPGEEYSYCDDCDFSSNREGDYRKHVETNHVEIEEKGTTSSRNYSLLASPNKSPIKDTNHLYLAPADNISSGEKTDCPVCSRYVTNLANHLKKIHPELDKIKDTPLYKEIMADKSMAHNAPQTKSNFHAPGNNLDYLTKLKEKISDDDELVEKHLVEYQEIRLNKEIAKERVITINNTAMSLEECSLCHQKVLYLSQHIQDVHGVHKITKKPSELASASNNKKEIDLVRKNIKQERNVEFNDNSSGEYVANLINKLKDFDSDEDEDDPEVNQEDSPDAQDIADTMDLIEERGTVIDMANDGLLLIEIDPKQLYNQTVSTVSVSIPPIVAISPVKPVDEESKPSRMGSSLSLKVLMRSLDHLPDTLAKNLKNSKYFHEHPTVLSKRSETQQKGFQDDPNLLPGWKVKFYPRPLDGPKKGKSDKVYLTPENMQVRSSFGVFEYMRCSGQYTEKQISDMKSYVPVHGGKKYL